VAKQQAIAVKYLHGKTSTTLEVTFIDDKKRVVTTNGYRDQDMCQPRCVYVLQTMLDFMQGKSDSLMFEVDDDFFLTMPDCKKENTQVVNTNESTKDVQAVATELKSGPSHPPAESAATQPERKAAANKPTGSETTLPEHKDG
jgi:hypothetical protein